MTTTPDFSHLEKLQVQKNKTADFEIMELDGAPVLQLVFAGESNREYFNRLAKRTQRNARRLRGGQFTAEMFEDNREHDRSLFPKYVIKGWRGITDTVGNAVEFSEAACAEFVRLLPGWIFDRVRNFAADPESFVASGDELPLSTEESADLGNS